MWYRESFERKYNIGFGIPSNFQVKEKKIIEISPETTKLCFNIKMPKSSCLKWTYGRSSIDYRVVSLFKRYLIAKGIIPESLSLIGQF